MFPRRELKQVKEHLLEEAEKQSVKTQTFLQVPNNLITGSIVGTRTYN